jgi:hypothetical protein
LKSYIARWHRICKILGVQAVLSGIETEQEGKYFMRKSIILFVITTLLTTMLVFSAQAQTYYRRVVRNGRVTWVRTAKPSYYRRHRNRINMAIGTGGGALLGGLIGGRKGALIGAGTGLAGSALYTYKLKKKRRVYRKVRRY